jgi:hypothetical protein
MKVMLNLNAASKLYNIMLKHYPPAIAGYVGRPILGRPVAWCYTPMVVMSAKRNW